ncbi:MAG: D-tyrosyl-tRNA(Tyr) deacylase [Alicyclobacillus macrosporangiidus]|uniref:D-aminoacyl-tRNA deacylase n=1 Tax=Alicyclobacillus macrosporangiidus TaxID=392015 RepID=UPI0026EA3357|nr:D-aminoacyl-tRNA deacylase [Alicyclobacillus macrosporangiidus]MCL6597675.1 D-tyrosyl-tRNA(Tyr) deacylase [Alicyclobacillus macrosporangiidus]
MRAVVQRSGPACVRVEGEVVGRVDFGLVVLLGVRAGDTEDDARYLAEKVAHLRVFADAEGKMNLDVREAGGSILSISQFTLYGDARKGRRPNYMEAARPEEAEPLYERFNEYLRGWGLRVETGRFGAMMEVSLVNDGPVTILLDSQRLF